jgi:hypothetical protein
MRTRGLFSTLLGLLRPAFGSNGHIGPNKGRSLSNLSDSPAFIRQPRAAHEPEALIPAPDADSPGLGPLPQAGTKQTKPRAHLSVGSIGLTASFVHLERHSFPQHG